MHAKPFEIGIKEISNQHFVESPVSSLLYNILKYTLGVLIPLIWVKEVTGLENLPPHGPVIVASNHASYFDFLCFISIAPRKVHYLAAEKFFTSRLWKPLMVATSQIRVERESKNKAETHLRVMSALKQQRVIGIFPEGTRSPNGEIQKPFTGVVKYALAAKSLILPVGIMNAHLVMAKHHRLPRLRKIISIHIGKPIDLTVFKTSVTEPDYLGLTHNVMIEIAKLSGKEYMHHLKP